MALLDWQCRTIDERRGGTGNGAEMADRCDVVVQEQSHGKCVDVVVRVHRSRLQHSRELADSRDRHVGQMYCNWIFGTLIRRDGGRRLRDDALEFSQSIGRAGRIAQRG